MEKEILSRGPKFGIPQKVRREEVFAEFEALHQQLSHHTPTSKEAADKCKLRLTGIAESFVSTPGSREGFSLDKEHFKTIDALRNNKDIVITRPDKGQGVVIMKRTDYTKKMLSILQDASKFKLLGDCATEDHTLRAERSLQNLLRDLTKTGEVSEATYQKIRPTGSSRPRMYGVPKVHKEGAPLRPILAMVGSAQHATAQWLAQLLKPVVEKYSRYVIKDSFQFSELIQDVTSPSPGHMCSYDIVSLFTNVPIHEAVDICADALYRSDVTPPALKEGSFRKLILKVTTGVQFSFDDKMWQQVDGVAMGSPLGPVLANIFVGFYEQRLEIAEDRQLLLYRRYVDDTFSYHENREHSEELLAKLNALHPSLRFTCEHEQDNRLPFLDVLTIRNSQAAPTTFSTTVHRKQTFTGHYTRWDSFSPQRHKLNLVKALVNRAMKICTPSLLSAELKTLEKLFLKNGYPTHVVDRLMKTTLKPKPPYFGPKACPVYIRLPWVGVRASSQFEERIRQAIKPAYYTCETKVVFTSRPMFKTCVKDPLPTHQLSNVIYLFQCRCDCRYVGKTTQHLATRIKQHVPATLRSNRTNLSAIGEHILSHQACEAEFDPAKFKVLCKARNKVILDILEPLFIAKLQPELCKQLEFVKKLHLFRSVN